MNKELIERLAREAGFVDYELDDGTLSSFDRRYARFAALVAEECAKECEAKGPELIRWWGDGQANAAAQECASAIRAKFPQPDSPITEIDAPAPFP